MKHIVPGLPHVILCTRESDGALGILYSSTPVRFLIAVNQHAPLEDIEIRASDETLPIVMELRQRFWRAQLSDPSAPWYLIDFKEAVAALDAIVRDRKREALTPGTEVYVRHEGRGRVESYSKCGRILVRLYTSPHVASTVLAPLEHIELAPPSTVAPGA